MLTNSATKSLRAGRSISTVAELRRTGWTDDDIRAQIAARRWQRFGRVIVLHGGPPTATERRGIAVLNCGSHAALTAFSAVEYLGLAGWERTETHVLVPGGTHVRRIPGVPVRLHYTGSWTAESLVPGRRLHRCAPALVVAATTFTNPRPACGLLAAGVQQQLVTATDLRLALDAAPRARHRALLSAAIDDIDQGAHALSEIDFAQLCRRYRLPEPVRQGVRTEPSGRRRYLDAEWQRADGRRVVAEVDGALHLAPRRWWDDQLRQNELVIAGDLVLRFPSVIVRTEAMLVADQLQRALLLA